MVQTFAYIFDLRPTEKMNFPQEKEFFDELKASIKKEGIKDQLNVNDKGDILKGNSRYWVALQLLLEGDWRFAFVPIRADLVTDQVQLMGLPDHSVFFSARSVGKRFIDHNINEKRPINKSNWRINNDATIYEKK